MLVTTSIFIPPSSRDVGEEAFYRCEKLTILSVSQNTKPGLQVIRDTPLDEACPCERQNELLADYRNYDKVKQWIKDENMGNEFDLHRECASYNPSEEAIYAILMERGLQSFTLENKIGITPSQYLQENPFSQIKEQKMINRLVLELMGEIIA
ncbi:predicted protein [Chaetoceros tenuissimus]|uniref:Uncharacterized protein n=1 Tax=Chaetoceros tenuissimus TaxID=426638 RepID=A0AAD3HB19_9STRA|nr:predicted protein [Chaetoceros tenuissimus]